MNREVGNNLILLIDIVSLSIGIYGLLATTGKELPPYLASGGHWQFLTNIALVITLIVFALGIIAHTTKNKSAFALKNSIHQLATSLELIVTLVYWPLRLLFLHLLVKEPSKKFISLPVDLAVHLMPLASLLTDYLAFMPKWTMKRNVAFAVSMGLTLSYYIYLNNLIDFENGGIYPYAFLDVESEILRLAIIFIVGLIGFFSLILLDTLYERVVDNQRVITRAHEKKVL